MTNNYGSKSVFIRVAEFKMLHLATFRGCRLKKYSSIDEKNSFFFLSD